MRLRFNVKLSPIKINITYRVFIILKASRVNKKTARFRLL